MKLSVKLNNIDDGLLFKQYSLRFGTQSPILTPTRSSRKSINLSKINEIYRKYNQEKLDNILKNESLERRENTSINNEHSQEKNLFIIDYSDINLPTEKQLKLLADIQYSHSDIVVTPTLSLIGRKLKAEELLERFLQITKSYIDIVETLNNKQIMGVIPAKMPRQYIDDLITFYIKNGINSYIIDYDGRSIDPNPSWQRNLMRELNKHHIFEESFLYSINLKRGKFMKSANEILAKDFIGLGFGIDILGFNHIPPQIPKDIWQSLGKNRNQGIVHLFSKENYSYIKLTESEFINKYLSSTELNVKEELERINTSNQLIETEVIKKELSDKTPLDFYLSKKSQVNENLLHKMKNLKKEAIYKTKTSGKISNWF